MTCLRTKPTRDELTGHPSTGANHQATAAATATLSPAGLLGALRRRFARRRLRGCEHDDLVQETMCRLLQIHRAHSVSLAQAFKVATYVWHEALRQRCRADARFKACDDLDAHVAQPARGERARDLRSEIGRAAKLSARERSFLDACLSGHDIESAGALHEMSATASYYLREKITNKIRTAERLRSLMN